MANNPQRAFFLQISEQMHFIEVDNTDSFFFLFFFDRQSPCFTYLCFCYSMNLLHASCTVIITTQFYSLSIQNPQHPPPPRNLSPLETIRFAQSCTDSFKERFSSVNLQTFNSINTYAWKGPQISSIWGKMHLKMILLYHKTSIGIKVQENSRPNSA